MKEHGAISIITVNYNNGNGLKDTIESVLKQDHPLEYIIIDGGSSDDSVSHIEKYAAKIDYHISEKDNGIYNAMNKGIAKASGEYLLFLNSGDKFCSADSLSSLIQYGKNADIIY